MKEYDLIENDNGLEVKTFAYYFEDGVYQTSELISKKVNNKVTSINSIKVGYTKNDKIFQENTTTANGFEFNGITFSLSEVAQINLTNLPNWTDDMFPCKWLGKNEEDFTLTLENKSLFYKAYLTKIRNLKNLMSIHKLNVV